MLLSATNGLESLTHPFSGHPQIYSAHPNYCNEDDATKGSNHPSSRTDSTNRFDVMLLASRLQHGPLYQPSYLCDTIKEAIPRES